MRARRMWAKAAVLATLIGAAVGVALYLAMDQISREWIAVIDQWLDWPLALIKVALPAASVEVTTSTLAFVSVAAALTGFLMVGGRRPLVDRLWPEPPGILNLTLFRQNADPDDPRFAGRTFVGRTEEMRALRRFAGDAGGAVPRWCALTAPHGIGKTRLALEWLDRLQKRGWDAGLLGSGKTLQDIERTHFRRKAAIVIDEALKDKDLWQKLSALLAGRRCVRILVIDQVPIRPPEMRDRVLRERIEAAQLEGIRIDRLDREALEAIAPEAAAETLDRADGRPLYVLLGPDPAATVARRVAERLAIAEEAGEQKLLAFAALAGPIENAVWQGQGDFPNSIALSRRERLFGGVDREVLKRVLPALAPEPFADALLLAWAMDQDDAARNRLFSGAIAANPSAVIARLRSLWTGPALSKEAAEARAALQHLFDEARLDLVAAMREDARRAVARAAEPPDKNTLDDALAELAAVADVRPHDREIQLLGAMGAVNAINHYGAKELWADLERWGARLTAVAGAWPEDREIQLEQAKGAVNAIYYYGEKGLMADLERWGARLTAVAGAWPGDREIQLQQAMGAVNAIIDYGKKGLMADLERWGARLTAVAGAWPKDREIQLQQAMGAVNAINHYGAKGLMADLERWGARLTAVAGAWPGDREIQLEQAIGAVNAIYHYGAKGLMADLERWRARLAAVALAHPGHLGIQEWAAKAKLGYAQMHASGHDARP